MSSLNQIPLRINLTYFLKIHTVIFNKRTCVNLLYHNPLKKQLEDFPQPQVFLQNPGISSEEKANNTNPYVNIVLNKRNL
jgi:hypothetical protein